MQLKQRLKKIKEKLAVVNPEPEFCGCYEKHVKSLLESVYNDDPSIEIEVYTIPDMEKGFCDKCRKFISKKNITYNKNVEITYGDLYTFFYYAKHLEYPTGGKTKPAHLVN